MLSSTTIYDTMTENPTFIFVDGSYFNFYRYFSLLNWWKMAYPENILADPYENPEFVEKFKKTFAENVASLKKNLKIDKNINPILIIGKDCRREDIWRTQIFKEYKGNRKNGPEDGFKGGPFFKMVYQEELFEKAGAKAILKYPRLEADDCIAISTKFVLDKYPSCSIYIITSDKDYLQLVEPRVKIFDLRFRNIAEQKSSFGSPEADLFCKIVMGDPSDNISSVLKKCGPKTVLKCFQDQQYFQEKMQKENAYEKFAFNKKIVDFNEIPQELVDGFINTVIRRQ